jgi:hypothetical protein
MALLGRAEVQDPHTKEVPRVRIVRIVGAEEKAKIRIKVKAIVNTPTLLILRRKTKGIYKCSECGIRGHTKKVCPDLVEDDNE